VGTRIGVSGRDSSGLGGGIVASRRRRGVGIGIGVSGRDSTGLGRWINSSRHDSGGLGGTVASRRDSGGLGGGIVGSGRDLGRLGGSMDGSGRDSRGLGGRIEGFGRVGAFAGPITRLLDRILGSNSCKAFRLALALSCVVQQVAQVANILLLKLVEGSLKKEEIERF
jgi:hypothetical protein